MAKSPDESSRYRVSGGSRESSFVDPDQTVLVNKLDIRSSLELAREEERGYATAHIKLLKEFSTAKAPITSELLKRAHKEIFGGLFEWAGEWRTVNIAKEQMKWPPPMFLEQNMQQLEKDVLSKYPAATLKTDAEFAQSLAVIQGEFLAVHPFREGNARTIKLCTNLLAVQTGRPLLAYDKTADGREAYIQANKLVVYRQDYSALAALISDALDRAQRQKLAPERGRLSMTEAEVRAVTQSLDEDLAELTQAVQEQSRRQEPEPER